MANNETELMVGTRVAPDQTTTATTDTPEIGRWYWVKWDDVPERWLGCVTHLGSNYVRLTGANEKHGETCSYRFHFNEFWESCEYVENPDPIIDGKILQHTDETRKLMDEVRRVTALLGVAHRQGLPAPQGEVQALAVRSDEPVNEYKAALIKAKDETLPDLFEKIKESNKRLSTWMKVKIVPMEAEVEALGGTLGAVKDRIFSVELYAGLVEKVEKVREGEHAPNDTKIHLMQRRHYMDEECLVGYETGGMDYKNLADFERWLAKPKNFNRVLPFPKCVVAFRIRRKDKHRETHTYGDYIRVMAEQNADRSTFLYIRNGEAMYRMETEIEFEEKLFPDTNHKILTAGQLWAKKHPFFRGIQDIITDAEYRGRIEDELKEDAETAKLPEDERRWQSVRFGDTVEEFERFTPESVYFDDINQAIQEELKKHNRIVLILQGLLDRSPVFVPHPPWQLWTNNGFELAFDLHHDDSRALHDGDKPDFEAYRAKLNARLWSGSLTIGQEDAWEIREAQKECRRLDNDPRDEGRYRPSRYRPSGDPGPGTLARIHKYRASDGACTFKWERKKRRRGWAIDESIEATLTTGEENLLNIDAYTPGDYLIFFNDPRTRQEYLKWAPMLLEAEEAHAGNRDLKPNRLLSAAPRKPVMRDRDRPMDLNPEKIRPKKPPIAEAWEGKKVRLRYDLETTKGTTFDAGEIMLVRSYERKNLTLQDPKDNMRRIRGVATYQVVLLDDEPEDEPAAPVGALVDPDED